MSATRILAGHCYPAYRKSSRIAATTKNGENLASYFRHVGGLRPFLSLNNVKFHSITFGKTLVAF